MTRLRSTIAALAIALMAAFVAVGATPAAPAHAVTYSVSGRLVDLNTGHAVANALIVVKDVEGGMVAIGRTHSGTRGYFTVANLPAVDGYAVFVDGRLVGYRAGYVTATHRISTWGNAIAFGPGNLGTVKLRHA